MNETKTLADKYLKDGIDVEEFIDSIGKYIKEDTGHALFCVIRNFLKTEVKPTLTEDEKVILRNIDIEHYQRIGRVKKGLYVANAVTRYYIKPFEPAFQFIKPRRRI